MSRIIQIKKGADVPLTKNFRSSEFDCRCSYSDCQVTLIDMDHVEKLQSDVRDKVNKAVLIDSGYRCEKHNRDVGGATHSRHRVSDATDIRIPGMSVEEVAELTSSFNGQGKYDTFVHVDSRPRHARWDFRTKKP